MKQEEILTILPTLTEEELKQIYARSKILLDRKKSLQSKSSPRNEWAVLFYDSIKARLRFLQITNTPDFYIFEKMGRKEKFLSQHALVDEFITRAFKPQTKTDRLIAYHLVARLIIRDLRRRKIPCSIGPIVDNLHRAEELFDTAYPDYLQNNLSPMLINAYKESKST